jgi:lipoyl(octanoyl) transferase
MNFAVRNYWISGKSLTAEKYMRMQKLLRKGRIESIIFCEHPPVITAGIQSKPQNLLTESEELKRRGIDYISVDRGGDHTSHEPGQLTVYIHVDLKKRNIKIGHLIQSVINSSIAASKLTWGIESQYNSEHPGIYAGSQLKKLAAVGLSIRNDFSSFGLSLNINNDLSTFSHIIPCGTPIAAPVSVKELVPESETAGLRQSVKDFQSHWMNSFCKNLQLQ